MAAAVSSVSLRMTEMQRDLRPQASLLAENQSNSVWLLVESYFPKEKEQYVRAQLMKLFDAKSIEVMELSITEINKVRSGDPLSQQCSLTLERDVSCTQQSRIGFTLNVTCHREPGLVRFPVTLTQNLSDYFGEHKASAGLNCTLSPSEENKKALLIDGSTRKKFNSAIMVHFDKSLASDVRTKLSAFCRKPEWTDLESVYTQLMALHKQHYPKKALPLRFEAEEKWDVMQYRLAVDNTEGNTFYVGFVIVKKGSEAQDLKRNLSETSEACTIKPDRATQHSYEHCGERELSQVPSEINKVESEETLKEEQCIDYNAVSFFQSAISGCFPYINQDELSCVLGCLHLPVTFQMLESIKNKLVNVLLLNESNNRQDIIWLDTEIDPENCTEAYRLAFKSPDTEELYFVGKAVKSRTLEKAYWQHKEATRLHTPVPIVRDNVSSPVAKIQPHSTDRHISLPQTPVNYSSFPVVAYGGFEPPYCTAASDKQWWSSSSYAPYTSEHNYPSHPVYDIASSASTDESEMKSSSEIRVKKCKRDLRLLCSIGMERDESVLTKQVVFITKNDAVKAIFRKYAPENNGDVANYLELMDSENNVSEICRNFAMLKGKLELTNAQIKLIFVEENHQVQIQVSAPSSGTWLSYKTYANRTFNLSIFDANRLIDQAQN